METNLVNYIRTDDWGTGSVRIFDIKVEKSDHATDYEE